MHTLKTYIKPETEKVCISSAVILEDGQLEFSVKDKFITPEDEAANDFFFAEEDFDDDYDPFFDD